MGVGRIREEGYPLIVYIGTRQCLPCEEPVASMCCLSLKRRDRQRRSFLTSKLSGEGTRRWLVPDGAAEGGKSVAVADAVRVCTPDAASPPSPPRSGLREYKCTRN
jgi:hypothetical protein